jgi:hypothetical protein
MLVASLLCNVWLSAGITILAILYASTSTYTVMALSLVYGACGGLALQMLRRQLKRSGAPCPRKIIVEERSHDWMAFLEGQRGIWGCGRTPYEAIGNCVNAHREMFGIGVQFPEIRPRER